MRALVQRVSSAEVRVESRAVATIGAGMLVLLGVRDGDGEEQARAIARKLLALRIFAGPDGRPDEPLGEREILCVSQFTLYADVSRGNRPSYSLAAPAPLAAPLYERVCELTGAARGVFGAEMEVELVGDGPLTVLLEA